MAGGEATLRNNLFLFNDTHHEGAAWSYTAFELFETANNTLVGNDEPLPGWVPPDFPEPTHSSAAPESGH